MFQHLLVPLDGSRLAEVALPWALYLAEAFGARVTLLHIQERRAPCTVHGEPHLTESVAAEEYLDGVITSFPAGVQADRHVHTAAEGDVAASIARHAGELGTDLVVLTAHGRPGVRTMLLGSIAQQVLRQAPMPVLLLRPEPAAQSPRLETLLVPLDGAPAAETALPFAAGLALTMGARVRLLLVVPTVGTLRDERAAAARISPLAAAEVLAIEEEHAAACVQNVAARMRQQGVAVSAEVARGNAVDVVVEAAKEVDLVVMASHGRSGLAALWSASIGSGVQARAETPLLLFNPSRRGLTPPAPGQLSVLRPLDMRTRAWRNHLAHSHHPLMQACDAVSSQKQRLLDHRDDCFNEESRPWRQDTRESYRPHWTPWKSWTMRTSMPSSHGPRVSCSIAPCRAM